jgi:uncharacterized protein
MDSAILEDWNPWWRLGAVPPVFLGERRTIVSELTSMMDMREILIISGIRRSGKTTIMYQLIENLLQKGIDTRNILFVNIEDPRFMGEDLGSIISSYQQKLAPEGRSYIFLDEIQQMKNWEQWLKMFYEQNREIKFIVSGSNSSLLMGEYATLLTGRNITLRVFPFSFSEYLAIIQRSLSSNSSFQGDTSSRNTMVHNLERFLEFGGFPEPVFTETVRHGDLVSQYFQDIMYRDIVFRHNVNPEKVTNLAVHLVTNSGNPISLRKLRNITGLSFDSLNSYLQYFEDSFLLKKVDTFSFSTQSKLGKQSPLKYFCADTGLRNVIAQRFSHDLGRNAENIVAIELWRRGISFSYWPGRRGKGEVDFVFLGEDGKPIGINVSYTDTIPDREIRGLRTLESTLKGHEGKLFLLTRNSTDQIEAGGEIPIHVMPLWMWLLDHHD